MFTREGQVFTREGYSPRFVTSTVILISVSSASVPAARLSCDTARFENAIVEYPSPKPKG